jgi:hypothetical protein
MPVSKNRKNHKLKLTERALQKKKDKELLEQKVKDFIAKAKSAKAEREEPPEE